MKLMLSLRCILSSELVQGGFGTGAQTALSPLWAEPDGGFFASLSLSIRLRVARLAALSSLSVYQIEVHTALKSLSTLVLSASGTVLRGLAGGDLWLCPQ